MNRLPTSCPFCEGELSVESLHCRQCDTTITGHFSPGPLGEFEEDQLPVLRRFARLNAEQLRFLEAFVRCEGKLNRLQEEIGLSYPTLRSRLDDLVRDLGFTPREEEQSQAVDRRQVLADLQSGKISATEAARLLRESRP
ncbi:MAG: DUF2089 domain-containing protein [Ardenticatenales bacterium]|nr:DUF2089 domain-containing protein [Ardenticatenales bacterium]